MTTDHMKDVIVERINDLVRTGLTVDDIYVNDGNSAWGDDCAVTREEMDTLAQEWVSDGQGIDDLPTLPTARQWYNAFHGI